MNIGHLKFPAFAAGCLLLMVLSVSGQSAESSGSADSSAREKTDERSAQELYEDANGYLGRKYAEFNKQKLGYDPKLEAKTKQEQKELALTNAAKLGRRKSLSQDDLYYLGMLRH